MVRFTLRSQQLSKLYHKKLIGVTKITLHYGTLRTTLEVQCKYGVQYAQFSDTVRLATVRYG